MKTLLCLWIIAIVTIYSCFAGKGTSDWDIDDLPKPGRNGKISKEDVMKVSDKAVGRNLEWFQAMLDNGLDVNLADKDDWSLLFALISTMRLQPNKAEHITSIIKEMISRGLDIHHIDIWKNNCLHYAATHGTPDLMKILLEEGVEVNKQDVEGNTPYHVLQPFKGKGKESLQEKIKILKKYNPDNTIQNYYGQFAEDILRNELETKGPSWSEINEMKVAKRVINEMAQEKRAKWRNVEVDDEL